MDMGGLSLVDVLGAFTGFFLTLCVFSYVLADNFLFRLAAHILIGVSAGLVVALVLYNVIWPQLAVPLLVGSGQERMIGLIPLVLSILLLAKAIRRLAFLGNPVMAFLVGVGAAAAVGGAISGTLFPQVSASMNVFAPGNPGAIPGNGLARLMNASLVLLGTVTTLAFFNFGVRAKPGMRAQRPVWLAWLAWIGQIFIAVTFGVVFAGIYSAALTALIERLYFIIQFILPLIFPGT